VGCTGRFASVGAAKIDEGLERRVAFSPSPQQYSYCKIWSLMGEDIDYEKRGVFGT
jgi:hypothetical protein